MVNNSTNTNITITFHLNSLNKEKDHNIQQFRSSIERHKNVAGLNWLKESQPSSLDNWIFKGYAYINKNPMNLTDFYFQE
jgi:hypothetical protein